MGLGTGAVREEFATDLFPRNSGTGISAVLGESALELRHELRRDGPRFVRRIGSDGVPQLFDELQPLGDGQSSELLEVNGALGHRINVRGDLPRGERCGWHANA